MSSATVSCAALEGERRANGGRMHGNEPIAPWLQRKYLTGPDGSMPPRSPCRWKKYQTTMASMYRTKTRAAWLVKRSLVEEAARRRGAVSQGN